MASFIPASCVPCAVLSACLGYLPGAYEIVPWTALEAESRREEEVYGECS